VSGPSDSVQLSPANTKISSEGRHREYPDLVCCIFLFDGILFVRRSGGWRFVYGGNEVTLEPDAFRDVAKRAEHDVRGKNPNRSFTEGRDVRRRRENAKPDKPGDTNHGWGDPADYRQSPVAFRDTKMCMGSIGVPLKPLPARRDE